MPRFVLLYHNCPSGVPRKTHWDFMLEAGSLLRTWVLDELPPSWSDSIAGADVGIAAPQWASSIQTPAEEIQPHRLDYLALEGPLSENRGSVTRVDGGSYTVHELSDCRVRATLVGRRLRGEVVLWRAHPQTARWQLSYSGATPRTE